MSAPTGNRFWELRAKHGRDKIFATADDLWEAACEYFEWCEKNPLYEHDFVGKDAIEVDKRKMRAMTLTGLCLFLGVNSVYFQQFEYNLKGKEDEQSKDFANVITRIRETMFTQKFTGAAAGLMNANIISRDLGLMDRQELTHSGGSETLKIEIVQPEGDE